MQMLSQTLSFDCELGLVAEDVPTAAAATTVAEFHADVTSSEEFGADVAFPAEDYCVDADPTAGDVLLADIPAEDTPVEDTPAEDIPAEDTPAEGPFAGAAFTEEEDLTENKLAKPLQKLLNKCTNRMHAELLILTSFTNLH